MAAGALTGGRATVAGQDTSAPKGRLALILVATVPETEHLLTIVRLGAAPGAATIFLKHPHIKGRSTIVLEVEGAPPAQAARAGERLPAAGQSYVARGGSLDRDPRGLAAATIRLQLEPAWTRGRQFVDEEARKLEPVAGRVLRPDDELRRHFRRMEARTGRPHHHCTPPFVS